jgi:hypothetical protein
MTGNQLITLYDHFDSELGTWRAYFQDLSNYVMPRMTVTDTTSNPEATRHSQLFDSTATLANLTLGQGQMSFLSPIDEQWFEFQPPYQLRNNDDAIGWYEECSAIAFEELALSNFYTEIHEMYLQRSGFGTAAMFNTTLNDKLFFRNYDIGTYAIGEDSNGFVNKFFRCWKVSAAQFAELFPDAPMPERVAAKHGTARENDEDFEIVHIIMPRKERDPSLDNAENQPFASYYLFKSTQQILKESGFRSFPVMVTRYLRWNSFLTGAYGWCPTSMAMPDIRQVNKLQEYMDVLAEIAAFPRVLVPSDLDGEVDLRAGGKTQFNPYSQNALPQEWATQGRYDVGKDRIEVRQKAINDAFHVDLFKMFASLDRGAQMSVREVMERSGEKLAQFSPTFTRLISEGFNPLLERIFNQLLDMGKFPNPPESIVQFENDQDQSGSVPSPSVQYTSRLALAIKAIQNTAGIQTLEALTPIVQIDPSVLDTFNMDAFIRGYARNSGVPESWLRKVGEVEAIRAQRAQAQAQQAQAEQALALAQAGAAAPTPEDQQRVRDVAG